MSFKVGDPIYNQFGIPGKVESTVEKAGQITSNHDAEHVKKHFRHGYLKGMEPIERDHFYEIMDHVKTLKDPKEKIMLLMNKIDAYENHEEAAKRRIAGYLKAELNHTMVTNNVHPRQYHIPFNRA